MGYFCISFVAPDESHNCDWFTDLLKITESKREERVKERLNDYYRYKPSSGDAVLDWTASQSMDSTSRVDCQICSILYSSVDSHQIRSFSGEISRITSDSTWIQQNSRACRRRPQKLLRRGWRLTDDVGFYILPSISLEYAKRAVPELEWTDWDPLFQYLIRWD